MCATVKGAKMSITRQIKMRSVIIRYVFFLMLLLGSISFNRISAQGRNSSLWNMEQQVVLGAWLWLDLLFYYSLALSIKLVLFLFLQIHVSWISNQWRHLLIVFLVTVTDRGTGRDGAREWDSSCGTEVLSFPPYLYALTRSCTCVSLPAFSRHYFGTSFF